ncbi:hypothetical protein PHMEG_00030967 [Phytophthora megakarya]|uniref:Aspartic protease n=1 Tax=Phytophthora megakarya TaxID=4795 RepID=A0A225UZQ2_9STRA|nr:hypothetical protein PHMEG_00030967 [Phytophthora megakarya]
MSIVRLDLARSLSLKIRTHRQIKVSGLGGISAGVRLCIREGLVKLPDEENVVMYDDVPRKRRGLELPVGAKENLYLRPGEAAVVKIEYRRKRWVTEILFGVRSWATAVRVVNVSDRNVWIDTRTALAWIVKYGHFPKEPGFARLGKIRYKEWQQLILESTESRQGRMRAECLEQLMRLRDPPAKPGVRVEVSEPSTTGAIARRTEDSERSRSAEDLREDLTFSRARDPEYHSPLGLEHLASETKDVSELVPEFNSEDVLEDVLEIALDDFSNLMDDASVLSDTPVQRLDREYERVIRVTVEELDLESAVYLREGTELLAQLSDHLTTFPELEELSPECDINKADVGVPGVTTPEMEDKMRM